MEWLFFILASSVAFALVSAFDKRLLTRYFRDVRGFNMAVGALQGSVSILVIATCLAVGERADLRSVGFAGASGIMWAGGLSLYFFSLSRVDVSRATPVWMTSPIFVALLAMAFLGNHVTATQWAAIVMVVVGAGLVSYSPGSGRGGFMPGTVVAALLVASAVQASAFVLSKEASDGLSVWLNSGLRGVGFGLGMLLFNLSLPSLRSIRASLRDPAGTRLLLFTEGFLAQLASLAMIVSITAGPIALVSSVAATRPLFLLGISVILSSRFVRMLNEPLDRSTLALKGVSTVMIVLGTVALAVL